MQKRTSVADFLARHLLKFPHWLKLILTVDSDHVDLVRLMHLPIIQLDGEAQHEAVCEYIEHRLFSPEAAHILEAVSQTRRPAAAARLVNLLVKQSQGSYLYSRLVMDQLEAGQLVLKSEAMSALPRTFAEALHLYFSLRFPTTASYNLVADILAICLSSTRPRSLAEVYNIFRSSSCMQPVVSYKEFVRIHGLMADLLVLRSDGSLMIQHNLITAWLTDVAAGRFQISHCRGHGLLLRSLDPVNLNGRRPASVLEFVHHLASCDLFRTGEADASLSVMDLKSLYLNFRVDRRTLQEAASYLPVSQFSSSWRMRQLLAISLGS